MFQTYQHLAKLIVTICLGTLCGCTEPVFEKLFSTEHIDYYVEQGGTPPCDGTGEWLERYYKANAEFFGAELPAGEKIEYYNVAKAETMISECQRGGGCAKKTRIYVGAPANAHEMVHANASLLGDPPFLFQEGLAEVLSCTNTVDSARADVSIPIENLIETSSFVQWIDDYGFAVYQPAASFVRYLINAFGADRFLAFYARPPRDAARADIGKFFKQELGVSLDDALAEWRKLPAPLRGDVCLRLMECDQSVPMLTNDEVNLGCGPSGGLEPDFEAIYRFRVEAGLAPHIVTAPADSVPQPFFYVGFYHCSIGNVMARGDVTAAYRRDKNGTLSVDPKRPTRRFVLDVPPGDYVAWFQSSVETQVGVEISESSSPLRNGCTPAEQPLVLVDNQDAVLTTRWMDRPCNGFWCPGHSWDVAIGPSGGSIVLSALSVSREMPYSPDKVYLCSHPCPANANQCEVVTMDATGATRNQSKQVLAPGTIVHVGAPLAPLKEHFSLRMRIVPPCNGRVPCTDPWHGPR